MQVFQFAFEGASQGRGGLDQVGGGGGFVGGGDGLGSQVIFEDLFEGVQGFGRETRGSQRGHFAGLCFHFRGDGV